MWIVFLMYAFYTSGTLNLLRAPCSNLFFLGFAWLLCLFLLLVWMDALLMYYTMHIQNKLVGNRMLYIYHSAYCNEYVKHLQSLQTQF